jgi:Isoleucyl-tRNA synthetase
MTVPSSPGELDPVSLESSLMETWEKESTFSESIESRREKNLPFTFLEGPPTANRRPGIHHVLSQAISGHGM